MLSNFIINYTKKITKEDIKNFALSQKVQLKDYETEIIYDQIKNNINNLISNTDYEISKIKDKLEYTTYLKIQELIQFYKNKYKDYL